MKKSLFAAFAAAGMIGLAACGGGDNADEGMAADSAAVDTTMMAPAPAPMTTDTGAMGAPMTTDTTDTTAAGAMPDTMQH